MVAINRITQSICIVTGDWVLPLWTTIRIVFGGGRQKREKTKPMSERFIRLLIQEFSFYCFCFVCQTQSQGTKCNGSNCCYCFQLNWIKFMKMAHGICGRREGKKMLITLMFKPFEDFYENKIKSSMCMCYNGYFLCTKEQDVHCHLTRYRMDERRRRRILPFSEWNLAWRANVQLASTRDAKTLSHSDTHAHTHTHATVAIPYAQTQAYIPKQMAK